MRICEGIALLIVVIVVLGGCTSQIKPSETPDFEENELETHEPTLTEDYDSGENGLEIYGQKIILPSRENIVNTGDTLILSDLIKYPIEFAGNDRIIVGIVKFYSHELMADEEYEFYDLMDYKDIVLEDDGAYDLSLKAPNIPGSYQVMLVEYPLNKVNHTYFNLTVLGEITTQDEAFQVAKKAMISDNAIVNITSKEINLLGNEWHVSLTVDYYFGCCSGCDPNSEYGCTADCRSCGIKTAEGYYIITAEGMIKEESVKVIACKPNGGVWFREISGNGLCIIDWDNLS